MNIKNLPLVMTAIVLWLSLGAMGATPPIPDPSAVIKLDEPFTDFHAANGGKDLVFFEKQSQKLVIYDTQSGQKLWEIPAAAPDIIFTCGQKSIVVALPAMKILQRYDLQTRERTRSAPIPDSRPLRKIKIGNNSTGPAFLYFGGELVPIDGATLAKLTLRGKLPSGNPDWWFDYRISSDGSTMASWDPYASPSGYSITHWKNGVVSTVDSPAIFSMADRQFTPTADGSLILYQMNFYDSTAHEVASAVKDYRNSLPTADPRFFIAVRGGDRHDASIALCTTNDRRVIASADGLPDIGDGDAGEPRVVLLPDDNTVAIVPRSNDQFFLLKLNPTGALAGARTGANPRAGLTVISLPPAEVAVNGTFSYQIQLLPQNAKVKYSVEFGPDGLQVSPTGLVTWKPAAIPADGKASVILSITDAAGHDIPHAFDITVMRGGTAAAAPEPGASSAVAPPDEVARVDEHRIGLPPEDCRYVQGMGGHALILAGNQLVILARDGFTIEKKLSLPKSYLNIAERGSYYVALCQDPKSIDVIDKTSLKVIRSRAVAFNELIDLTLNPTAAISYVTYKQPSDLPSHHFLIFDEATADARTNDDWLAQWLAISPDGAFLMGGFEELYQNGNDLIVNPDQAFIVPKYGSLDVLLRYDLDRSTGLPARVAHRENVGGNGVGIRLSADGRRATYLSHTGYPEMSHDLGGWVATDLSKLPVTYTTKDAGSTLDLAYHPILPLVACIGKGSVLFFNRETGAAEEGRLSQDLIAGENDIERIYFSPDGKSVLVQTGKDSSRYLYHLPLKLSSDEIRTVGALPRPDRPLRQPSRLPDAPQQHQALPKATAEAPSQGIQSGT